MSDSQISWSNGMGSRGRAPFLLFINGDKVITFEGRDIKGVVVVRGNDYKKNGKWSETIFRLQLADGIRHIAGYAGWATGRFVEGLGAAVCTGTPDTWSDLARALGVSVPSAMEFLRSWKPKAAAKLDEVEHALAKLEEVSESETDSVIVTVGFGSPTNRAIREGYWKAPKRIPEYDAEILLKDSSKGWVDGNIQVVGIVGSVLSVKSSAGMHGGYYAVTVAVIPGTETGVPHFGTIQNEASVNSDLTENPNESVSGNTSLGDALRKAGL